MKNKDILIYANFGDKFVCRNGDIAIYLWMNGKEGYSLQLENEKKPQHYDVDGHWHSQNYKENPCEETDNQLQKAIEVLKEIDLIACEDSRVTQKLLNHYDIKTKCIS